jgi:hypothetical protein
MWPSRQAALPHVTPDGDIPGAVYAEVGGRPAMKQRFITVVVIGVTALVSGCASADYNGSAASPSMRAAADCERNGGVWRAALNFCEYQAPESPRPPR